MDWQWEGPRGCGRAWARRAGNWESVSGPSRAGRVEKLPRGGLRALWHPGLGHILVSEVKGGDGGGVAEAAGAGAWDLGADGGAGGVGAVAGAEDAGVGAGVAGVRPGGGV